MNTLTVEEVCKFLDAANLSVFTDDFRACSVDGAELVEITSLDLLSEISTKGRTSQKRKLINLIVQDAHSSTSTAPSTSSLSSTEQEEPDQGESKQQQQEQQQQETKKLVDVTYVRVLLFFLFRFLSHQISPSLTHLILSKKNKWLMSHITIVDMLQREANPH